MANRRDIRDTKRNLIGYLEESSDRIDAIGKNGVRLGTYKKRENETRRTNGTLIARYDATMQLLTESN